MNTAAKLIQIPLDLIDVGERLRKIDPDWVAFLAESFREHGQETAVRVTEADPETGRHRLITGGHRYEAARLLGWRTIEARTFSGSALEAELLEIDENLVRRELSELDRAAALARRKEIYQALHPETGRGKARLKGKSDNSVAMFPAFTAEVAGKLGVSRRTVERAISRYTRIAPDVRARISTTWLADRGAELDALAKLEPPEQRLVVAAMLREEQPPPSVASALREVRGAPEEAPDVAERQYAALLSAWRKAGKRARRAFVDYLVQAGAIDAARSGSTAGGGDA